MDNKISNVRENQNVPDKLVVYLSAAPHGFQKGGVATGDNIEYLYPSKHIVGTRMVGGELNCLGGNVFAQALQEYSNKTDIEIEIHYVEENNSEKDIFEILDETDELPDLILLNKHSQYDYYRLAQQGYLVDFSVFMEEELKDETMYYQKVINGGRVEGQQVILPILFNLNGMITSKSYIEQIGCEEFSREITYDDVLYTLQQSCVKMADMQQKEAIFEASGLMLGGTYIPSIMMGAGHTSYFDEDIGSVNISSETVADILELMRLYNRQEFGIDPDWENKTYLENLSNKDIKSGLLTALAMDTYSQVGIFLSGGRSGGINFHNSLLTDAAYFNSMYSKDGEEMVLCGIPTVAEAGTYSANMSVLAAGFSTTEYPKAVYDLARYMMDYKYPSAYGFSVNKEVTEEQLEEIQNTTTVLYSDGIWSSVIAGIKTEEEIESEIEIIQPLDSRYVEEIQFMLDHMAGAGVPFGTLEYHIFNTALESVADNDVTCQEVGDWVVDTLEVYLERYEELEAFVDRNYIESLKKFEIS